MQITVLSLHELKIPKMLLLDEIRLHRAISGRYDELF